MREGARISEFFLLRVQSKNKKIGRAGGGGGRGLVGGVCARVSESFYFESKFEVNTKKKCRWGGGGWGRA